jgi:hypothetical protein
MRFAECGACAGKTDGIEVFGANGIAADAEYCGLAETPLNTSRQPIVTTG